MSQRIGACYPPLMSLAAGVLGALVQVQNLAAAAGIERVVFGSYSPMFYFESALLKVREAALPEVQNDAVFSGNARRLLAKS